MAVAEAYTPTLPTRRGKAKAVRARSRLDLATAGLIGLVTVIALAAPVLAPHNPLSPVGVPELKPGQGGFLLGSDTVGRDILSRILYGLRSSWLAALAVVALGLLVGGLIGLVAGASGGWIDNVLMRITDGFLALPAPIVAIAVVAGLGGGLFHTLIAVSIVWWPFYARIVRGEIRTLAARPHVEAARLAGSGRVRVALRHLLPGAIPSAAVTASLDIGNLVLTLAGLSFLGLGASAPAPELGADTARNLSYLLQDWWIPVMPGIAVALLALAANVAGDGVRNLMAHR
ncbi:MAG: peptide/nickel transport system permease protein [Frankiales bacterium]|jgi:peptide/nickel transport system permease protein|nr:peptide/nickel transport system permease protein [Frankiales bacterium]MDX6256100.1 peptide/nickel transport system permease protein [Frankiales bacterium]